MRKTASTGNIYFKSPQINKMKERFSLKSTKNFIRQNSKEQRQLKLIFSSNISSDKPPSMFSNTSRLSNRTLPSKYQRQLYEELKSLKKQVNNLNSQIAFAKSMNRKKDVQISLRNKELDTYKSDIKMSKDILPVNIDKLKDSNMISSIKKEYYNAKNLLNAKKEEAKSLEQFLKKAKPNKEIQKNEELEKQLIELVESYKEIQQKNAEDSEKIKNLEILGKIFNSNHTKIEEMQNVIYETENKVNGLRAIAKNMNNENSKNNEILKKQNIHKNNASKHIKYLMNVKKSKEEIVKLKAGYEKKIAELEKELNKYKSKCATNEKNIDDIKKEIEKIEEMKTVDPMKLEEFDYDELKRIERNPSENTNSKILLLQSLIEESDKKIKTYKENILSFNEQLKELGYEPFDLKGIIDDNEENINENKNGDDNNEDKTKDNNNDKDNNKDIEKGDENNQEVNNDKDKDNNKDNEKDKEKNMENENNNINIKNDINTNMDSNNKQRIESTRPDDGKNENNIIINNTSEIQKSNKTEELKEQINNSANKDNINNTPSTVKKEKENNNNEINENNDIAKNTLSEEAFTEFTFVLIKNLEAKKITTDIAKQKIILIQNKKDEIPKDKFVQQMSNNILTVLNCKNEESIKKLNNWLYFMLNLNDDNQSLMTEKFLSLLSNVKTYTSEQELTLTKKVKKYLLPKKDIILSKLEPFKNKYISFIFLKQIIEEQKIEMKDEYSQYLFYALKRFDAPEISLYDLKVQNLFDIMNNDKNDSKMDEESDVEITNEEYTHIITSFGMQLLNYLNSHNTTLKNVLSGLIQNISAEDEDDAEESIEIVFIEPFINRMKEIGIKINGDIETFCLYSRYKLSDEYEVISVNLLEKELENFNNLAKISKSKENKDKLMEKVQEENEDNDE